VQKAREVFHWLILDASIEAMAAADERGSQSTRYAAERVDRLYETVRGFHTNENKQWWYPELVAAVTAAARRFHDACRAAPDVSTIRLGRWADWPEREPRLQEQHAAVEEVVYAFLRYGHEHGWKPGPDPFARDRFAEFVWRNLRSFVPDVPITNRSKQNSAEMVVGRLLRPNDKLSLEEARRAANRVRSPSKAQKRKSRNR